MSNNSLRYSVLKCDKCTTPSEKNCTVSSKKEHRIEKSWSNLWCVEYEDWVEVNLYTSPRELQNAFWRKVRLIMCENAPE